jgi:hypothetical protein
LSSNEIRRLLATLVLAPVTCAQTVLSWSIWRRRRQHQAPSESLPPTRSPTPVTPELPLQY